MLVLRHCMFACAAQVRDGGASARTCDGDACAAVFLEAVLELREVEGVKTGWRARGWCRVLSGSGGPGLPLPQGRRRRRRHRGGGVASIALGWPGRRARAASACDARARRVQVVRGCKGEDAAVGGRSLHIPARCGGSGGHAQP
eukprot:360908-Chlamydomonas_euryale.AAC.12